MEGSYIRKKCEKLNIVLRKGLIISLSVLLILPFALYFGGHNISAAVNPFNKSTSYYTLSFSEDNVGGSTTNNGLLISWRPNTTYDFIQVVDIKYSKTVNGSTQKWTLRLALYDTGNITYQLDSGGYDISSSTITVESVYSFQKGVSEQQYYSNVINALNSMSVNGIHLNTFDVDLKSIGAIAYFGSNGGVLQTDYNDFLNETSMLFDWPIYQGYSQNTSSYLVIDSSDDEYIFIQAFNNTYNIFTNCTGTPLTGWSTVTVHDPGQYRYSQGLQVNYVYIHGNKDGTDYTGSRFYLNFASLAQTRMNDYQYIPIYFGKVKDCPDEFLALCGLKSIDETNADTISSNLNDTTDDLNTELTNIDTIQNDLTSDFEDNIQAIDTDFSYNNSFGSKFLLSNGWLIEQFNNLTVGNPLGSALTFALLLGLALLLIGRIL